MELRAEFGLCEDSSLVPIFADDDRNLQLPRNEQRLVAKLARQARRIDQSHSAGLAPVSAGQHVKLNAACFKQLAQQHDEGSLTRSARRKIAHAYDWTLQAALAQPSAIIERVARPDRATVDS